MVKFSFSHEEFTTIMNEAENYHKLKRNIKLTKSQRKDREKVELIKYGTKMGIYKNLNFSVSVGVVFIFYSCSITINFPF